MVDKGYGRSLERKRLRNVVWRCSESFVCVRHVFSGAAHVRRALDRKDQEIAQKKTRLSLARLAG